MAGNAADVHLCWSRSSFSRCFRSHSFGLATLRLALAFVVRGLKEFGEPSRKALIIAEGKPELRARTFGAYYLIRDCVVTSGSFLGARLWHLGSQINFLGSALSEAAGTFWFWRLVLNRTPNVRS